MIGHGRHGGHGENHVVFLLGRHPVQEHSPLGFLCGTFSCQGLGFSRCKKAIESPSDKESALWISEPFAVITPKEVLRLQWRDTRLVPELVD